jgi:hypothetical protein
MAALLALFLTLLAGQGSFVLSASTIPLRGRNTTKPAAYDPRVCHGVLLCLKVIKMLTFPFNSRRRITWLTTNTTTTRQPLTEVDRMAQFGPTLAAWTLTCPTLSAAS